MSGLSCIPDDALLTHSSSSPFLSTHLRSNNKKFVNDKQHALPSTDIPVPLTSLYIGAPHLHIIWRRRQDTNLRVVSTMGFQSIPLTTRALL